MGQASDQAIQYEDMRGIAEEVAIAAKLGSRCEIHPGEFISEGPDADMLVDAYKIGNARITSGEIELPPLLKRQDFTDLIKDVVENGPDACPECERIFGKND